jgi:hypothetical protein
MPRQERLARRPAQGRLAARHQGLIDGVLIKYMGEAVGNGNAGIGNS